MKFEHKFKIGLREIGLNNKLSNYGILAYLQDLATMHSDTVDYGVKDVFSKKQAWLLMDWQLEVKNRPAFNEDINIETYAVASNKPSFHCYRDFNLFDKNNNLIATATSKWVLFDSNINKIVKVDENIMNKFGSEGNSSVSEAKLKKLKERDLTRCTFEYTVNRADIDVNKHVNNLNYLKFAYEAIPEDLFFGEELNNLRIMYKHQIKLGDKIKCCYSFEDNKHSIAIKSEDEKTLHAIVELW